MTSTKVLDVRVKDKEKIRKRYCISCGCKFTTEEKIIIKTKKQIQLLNKFKAGGSRGTNNPRAVLTEQNVRDLRQEHARGVSTAALVERYGMSSSQIGRIIRRECWAHLD